jgi:hypothetical protein
MMILQSDWLQWWEKKPRFSDYDLDYGDHKSLALIINEGHMGQTLITC